MKRVVSIVGPTASGKTGLGIAIAKRLAEAGERAEIVNADAYQMYRGMDIGTAKASAEEQAAVPHHLIDIIDPTPKAVDSLMRLDLPADVNIEIKL